MRSRRDRLAADPARGRPSPRDAPRPARAPGTPASIDDIDLSRGRFWALPLEERDAAFALLRRERPVAFFAEPRVGWADRGAGFHALTRHADVVYASRHPEIFSSARGVLVFDRPPAFLEFFDSMINMDDPRHTRLRRIVSRAFTPQMIGRLTDDVRRIAARIVTAIAPRGGCDFTGEVADRLPLEVICTMMGIPERDYRFVLDRTNLILGSGDPEYTPDRDDPSALLTAAAELSELVADLGRHRAEHPREDLISALVHANIDGERLSSRELGSFFGLLVQAGTETTRNAISHGLKLLTDNPDQKALLISAYERHARTAVEEILRVASPIIYMRRTLTRDTELHGTRLPEGGKVLLFYWSANRDDTVFAEPGRFDITREPNPHLSFGAPGPHYCLGAHLARLEITVMFRELLAHLPDIRASGEPSRLRSSFLNGIKHLPCEFTPA